MSKRVGSNSHGDPSAARDFADDPSGAVPVEPPPVRGLEYRPAGAFADGQVDRPGPGAALAKYEATTVKAPCSSRHVTVPAKRCAGKHSIPADFVRAGGWGASGPQGRRTSRYA